jgi:AraC-like DNA-binding protein
MSYSERPAPNGLGHAVAAVWRVSSGSSGGIVVPDNCTDILMELHDDGSVHRRVVVGVMTRPIETVDRDTTIIGVRFRPGWARAVLGVPAHVLCDQVVPLVDVSAPLARTFSRAHRPVRHAEQRLLTAVAGVIVEAPAPPAVVCDTLSQISRDGGQTKVAALAKQAGSTRQHLARQFSEWVGVTPKLASRVVRLERAVAAGARHGWSRTACDLGFADQSHLTREMRALRGVTPSDIA